MAPARGVGKQCHGPKPPDFSDHPSTNSRVGRAAGFYKNDVDLDVAWLIPDWLHGVPLFPHVLTKNCAISLFFGPVCLWVSPCANDNNFSSGFRLPTCRDSLADCLACFVPLWKFLPICVHFETIWIPHQRRHKHEFFFASFVFSSLIFCLFFWISVGNWFQRGEFYIFDLTFL